MVEARRIELAETAQTPVSAATLIMGSAMSAALTSHRILPLLPSPWLAVVHPVKSS